LIDRARGTPPPQPRDPTARRSPRVNEHGEDANFAPFDHAHDWLHVGLGVGVIALALLTTRTRDPRTANTR
jgi:hypothetical protein